MCSLFLNINNFSISSQLLGIFLITHFYVNNFLKVAPEKSKILIEIIFSLMKKNSV